MATHVLSRRSIRALDVILALWIATWVGVGVVVFQQLSELTEVSKTLTNAGRAVENTGKALELLDGLPVLGGPVAEIGAEIRETGARAQESARSSRERIEVISLLLGAGIALTPTVPPLALYLPLRLSWSRDRRSIRRDLSPPHDPALEEYLARRAVEHLGYHKLRRITPNPSRDLKLGRHRPLAEAELKRLGLLKHRR